MVMFGAGMLAGMLVGVGIVWLADVLCRVPGKGGRTAKKDTIDDPLPAPKWGDI